MINYGRESELNLFSCTMTFDTSATFFTLLYFRPYVAILHLIKLKSPSGSKFVLQGNKWQETWHVSEENSN